MKPYGLAVSEAARLLRMEEQRLSGIVDEIQGIDPGVALRLERLFGASAEMWLQLQRDIDLWKVLHSPAMAEIRRIQPFRVEHLE